MLRERLPNRRGATTFDIEAGGLRYTTTIGYYPDGRIGEIFITNHKAGSQAGIMASDAAVVASVALQYGTPLDVIRKALMRDSRGNASSPLGRALDELAKGEIT
jgi:hypothetical protein